MAGRGSVHRDLVVEVQAAHPVEDGPEPIGTLRVPTAEVVVEVPLVGQEQDGHALGTLQAATTVADMTGHRLLPGQIRDCGSRPGEAIPPPPT